MSAATTDIRIVRASPLHTRTAEANIRNDWTQWNGFTVPAACAGTMAERRALNIGAGLFDLSPLAKLRIVGPDAASYAARLCTIDATQMAVGSVRFAVWCDGNGFVRGEGRLLRLRTDEFLLLSALDDTAWWRDSAEGFAVTLEDMSAGAAIVGLMGPSAASIMTAAELDVRLAPGTGRSFTWRGIEIYVTRSRAYGGHRFEILCTSDDAILVWDRLLRAGGGQGLTPVGTQALDAVRVEAGYPCIGIDYLSSNTATGAELRTPSSLGYERFVELDRAHFNGRRTLVASAAPAERLIRIAMETNEARAGGELLAEGRRVGYLTSVANDPVLPKSVGLAWIANGTVPAMARFHDRSGLRPRSFEATLRTL